MTQSMQSDHIAPIEPLPMTTLKTKKKGGRALKYGEPTTAIRVPQSIVPTINDLLAGKVAPSNDKLLALVARWEDKAGNSPRWHFCKMMLTELKELCNDEQS